MLISDIPSDLDIGQPQDVVTSIVYRDGGNGG
jgi:hypothetical protein